MLEAVTLDTFVARVGETFRVSLEGGVHELVLVAVERPGEDATEAARRAGLREPFSILFRGPGDALLPQRIYRLEHEELGALELFLVPIGPDGTGLLYEAVFG